MWKKKKTALLLSLIPLLVAQNGCVSSQGLKKLNKPESMEMPKVVKATVKGYSLAYDDGLIYNPISAEAEKMGTLNKYDGAKTRRAVLRSPSFEAEFTLPTEIEPYDAVPIDYKITRTGDIGFPLSIVATAFEEPGRGSGDMFDLAVPGSVDISLKYLGYVTGTIKEGARHIMKADNSDTPADAYPNYETTPLTPSGTVKSGDLVWLKFQYTNIGNTILDAEGTGGFVIEPRLLERQANGSYIDVGGLFNQYIRELTYVYPGETREFWLKFVVNKGGSAGFSPQGMGLAPGDYRVNFKTFFRTEYNYEPLTTIWAGHLMQEATFDFTVAEQPAQTEPEPVKVLSSEGKYVGNKRSWLHYFEEFMTTYEQYATDPGKDVLTGRIYIQPAPFTKQIVLKVIHGQNKSIIRAAVPVTMKTDGLSIKYNPDNINVVIGDDGLAVPAIYAQPMSGMRANVDISPYPQETIAKDLLLMKECGINLINTQGWFYLYDVAVDPTKVNLVPGTVERRSNVKGDALKYMLDLSRRLGFKLDGMGTFYFGDGNTASIAKWITGKSYSISMASKSEADHGDDDIAKALAAIYLYQRSRWGDIYWRGADGATQYIVEDTRGYMRYEYMDGRMALGNKTKEQFREWLKEKYKTVETMNQAWGTNYKSFGDVDPERGQAFLSPLGFMDMYDYTSNQYGFGEWGPAVQDLDEFRTAQRIKNYSDTLAIIRETDKTVMFQLRTEGSNMCVPGLDPATTNAHYRNLIYNQRRTGSIAEMLAPSDAVRSYADYPVLPLTPSEVYEVVKKSVDAGLIPMLMPQFNNMRDVAINERYGRDFSKNYNLEKPQLGAYVKALTALFPWWKATYEAGGVPGILWQDLGCDGVVTETQQKEMKFFKAKIEQMLSDSKIQKQRKMKKLEPVITEGKYSYNPAYIDEIIRKVSGQSE